MNQAQYLLLCATYEKLLKIYLLNSHRALIHVWKDLREYEMKFVLFWCSISVEVTHKSLLQEQDSLLLYQWKWNGSNDRTFWILWQGDQSCMWQQEADHCDVSCRCSKCNIVGPLQLPLITVSSDTAWYLLHPRSSSALTQCETASVDQLASSHTQTTWCGLNTCFSPQCLWYLSVCVLVYWSHLKQSTFSPLCLYSQSCLKSNMAKLIWRNNSSVKLCNVSAVIWYCAAGCSNRTPCCSGTAHAPAEGFFHFISTSVAMISVSTVVTIVEVLSLLCNQIKWS